MIVVRGQIYLEHWHIDALRNEDDCVRKRYSVVAVALAGEPFRLSRKTAAEMLGIGLRHLYRLLARFKKEGIKGLRPRSRRPLNVRMIDLERRQKIVDIRLALRLGCEKIACEVGCSPSTVHKVLRRLGLIWDEGPRTRWKFYERQHANSML